MSYEFTDTSGRPWKAGNGELAFDTAAGQATAEDMEKAAADEIVALVEKCSRLERGQAIVDRANYRKALMLIANGESRDPQILIDIARGALRNQVFDSYCSFRVEVPECQPTNRHPIAKMDWRAVTGRR